MYNDTAHRAKHSGSDAQNNPTYDPPEKFDCRREKVQVASGEDGRSMGTKTKLTTAEIEFNEDDLIWLSEDDETNTAEGHQPDEVGWSETDERLATVTL